MISEEQKKIIIVGVLTLGIVLLGYLFIFSPLWTKNKKLMQESQETAKEVKRISDIFKDKDQINKIEAEIARMDGILTHRIPDKITISQLNEILVAPANENKVLIETMSFGSPQVSSTAIFPWGLTATYKAISIDLNLSSTRSAFVEYLKWIKMQERYISIDEITINAKDKWTSFIKANLKLRSYSINIKEVPYSQIIPKIMISEQYFNSIDSLLRQESEMIAKYQIVDKSSVKIRSMQSRRQEESFRAQNFQLQGTVLSGYRKYPTAIISGKFLRKGDTISGYKVVAIEEKRVFFKKDGYTYILEMKEGR